jgi:hypothetical protein
MCIQDKDHEKKGSVGQDNEVIQVFFFFFVQTCFMTFICCVPCGRKRSEMTPYLFYPPSAEKKFLALCVGLFS